MSIRRPTLRTFTIAFLIVSTATVALPRDAQTTERLDGAIFEIERFDEHGASRGVDQLVFSGGRLASGEMRNLGCWPAAYTASAKPNDSGPVQFEARFETAEGSRVRLRGTVDRMHIEGSIDWPEADDPIRWTFSGRRAQGLLDSQRFRIEIAPDDPDAPWMDEYDGDDAQSQVDSDLFALPDQLAEGTDVLVFRSGGFHTDACLAVGFPLTYYAAEEYGGAISFAATSASASVGTVEWSGSVENDRIEGELRWTSVAGTVVYYSFRGERVSG